MMIKYPIHKVAKDFKKGSKELQSKEVMDILTQYGHPPKNHMQPLTDQELSLVFEYLTQHNQVDSIQSIYEDVYHEPAAAKAEALAKELGYDASSRTRVAMPRPGPSRASSRRPISPRCSRASRPCLSPPAVCPPRRWWTPAAAAR